MKVGESKKVCKCNWCDGDLLLIKDEGDFKYHSECSNFNCITNILKRRKLILRSDERC